MRKYDGTIIHQSHDDDGILEVVESEGMHSLHFGSESRQSSMLLSDPNFLQLSYLRAMMSWNLFQESFENALIIGLGGGSLAKHLLHYFPEGQIRAIEYRSSVVKIARSHFGLPLDPRLKVIIDDGGKYIQQAAKDLHQYDLVLIDAYDHESMSASVNGEEFFDACRLVLKRQGVMVINLWRSDKALFEQTAWYMSRSFNEQTMFLPVRGRANIIGLGFPERLPELSDKSIKIRAELMEIGSRIEYPVFLKDLKKYNRRITTRFFKL